MRIHLLNNLNRPAFYLRLTVAVVIILAEITRGIPAHSQVTTEPLDSRSVARLAVQRSPTVVAAELRLQASEAALRGAGAPFSPRAEVAPGLGFTNANALLSQQIDIGGLRSSIRSRAEGERDAARANLASARLQSATEARLAYFDLARARQFEESARSLVELAQQLQAKVARRVELGEAPAVQNTRAEIETARAEQELVRARADSEAKLAILNRLLGRKRNETLTLAENLILPGPTSSSVNDMVEVALRTRPDIAAVVAGITARRGAVNVARAQGKPLLYAEIAADFWSVDRYSWDRRTASGNLPLVGFQARLSFPLGQDRAQRAEVARAQAALLEQEAEVEAIRRTVAIEIERLAAELTAAREVATRYQRTIVPKAEELARATRGGFENGLSSFIEVLEAQRVLRQAQVESLNALYDAVRVRLTLDAALGVSPDPIPAPATKATP